MWIAHTTQSTPVRYLMLGDGAVALGPDSALRLREVRSCAPKIRVACSLLDGVSKYQEGETMTGIGPRAVGIVDLEPTTQRVISDLAHDAAARPDVLHHELYNVADRTRLITASFEYHALGAPPD
jgi:hypothetical protein